MHRIGQKNGSIATPAISNHHNRYSRRESDRSAIHAQSFQSAPARVNESFPCLSKLGDIRMDQEDGAVNDAPDSSESTPDTTMSLEDDTEVLVRDFMSPECMT